MEALNFGQDVRQRRREMDLTQEELARRVGCAAITIRKIEAETARPSVQIAERLAMALGIPLDQRADFVRRARAIRPEADDLPAPAIKFDEIGLDDLAGRAVHGYALSEKIGTGGMGVVYRAVQPLVEREVAIKIIQPAFANQADFIRRFEAEAQLVARLEHPHIVPLYDYWRDPGLAYLVMRLLRGGSLDERLQGQPLPIDMVARMVEQIGSALSTAHRIGVIHRDLKPANILLDEDQNTYLSDFGIAKNLGNPEIDKNTRMGELVGSPFYMAPEQIQSQGIYPQTDIYCFGILLYELLTGHLPYTGPTPFDLIKQQLLAPMPPLSAHVNGLPAALDQVIARATAKKTEERYHDMSSLLTDFRKAVAGLLSQPIVLALEPAFNGEAANPYKGLRAFGEADAEDFFGRETLVQQLLARLGEGGELARYLAVVGPSGSGKSSVVRAGLLPALRRGALAGSEHWFYTDLMPGRYPFEELEAALLRVAANPLPNLVEMLQSGSRGLVRAVNNILPADPAVEMVLVIDQFEELFTLTVSEEERSLFLNNLVTAVLDERSRLRVILTLRADFIDRPLRYMDFGELIQRRNEFILPLNPEELERAITSPARRVGLRLESNLVTTIVHDLGEQPGTLPLLQYALTELYDRRVDNVLTLAAYRELGGVRGALSRRADEIFSQMNAGEQESARQLFLQLVTLGEGSEDTRRRALLSEIETLSGPPGLMHGVIEAFARARLLSFDRDPLTHAPVVEVAHEALIREWGRLSEWVQASRADLRIQRQLAVGMKEWQAANCDPSFLMAGLRLAQIEGWAVNTSLALTADERAYLEASLAERRRLEAEEEARRQRELEAARQLAETEAARGHEQAEAAERLRRRNRVILAAGVVALVLALAAGVFGFQSNRNALAANTNMEAAHLASTQAAAERADAQRQALLATVRDLASEANLNLAVDPERSTLLSIRALKLALSAGQKPEMAAVDALHRALQASRILRRFSGHKVDVSGLAYSPDGSKIASLDIDGNLLVWDAATGISAGESAQGKDQALVRLSTGKLNPAQFYSFGFSPDGKRLVAGVTPDQARVWDLASGKEARTLSGHTKDVLAAVYSPDGQRIATASQDKTAIIWDAASGKPLHTLVAANSLGDVAFSPDGHMLATAGTDNIAPGDKYVNLWDVATGQMVLTLTHSSSVYSVAFSPDGTRLATGAADGAWRTWDTATGQPLLSIFGHASLVTSVAFDSTGEQLATASTDGAIKLWDTATGRELSTIPGHANGVSGVAFSPDDSHLASASADTTVRIWDLTPSAGSEWYTLLGHTGRVMQAAFSPDGSLIASASEDNTVRVWDAGTGANRYTIKGFTDGIWSLSFSPDGKRLAATAGVKDGFAKIYAVESGKELQTIPTDGERLIFSPDGKHLATTTADFVVRILDASTGAELLRMPGHTAFIQGLAFSPDGTRLASTSEDNSARVWDTSTGKTLFTLNGHGQRFVQAAFSPDGRYLATSGSDSVIHVWDAQTGAERWALAGHTGPTFGVAFSPDGHSLATSSVDRTVKVWDLTNGVSVPPPLTLYGHTRAIYTVAFSPDGKRLLTASRDGTARVYALDLQDLIQLAQARLTRTWTEAECQLYLYQPVCPAQ